MIFEELDTLINLDKVTHTTRFHKKNYINQELDYFIHFNMQTIRSFAKKYAKTISEEEFHKLITHKYHEYRMIAFIILVDRIKDQQSLKESFKTYDHYIRYANNWDLVDCSAPHIIGRYVYENNQYEILCNYAKSSYMWVNRIAVVSTLYIIKKKNLNEALKVIESLLDHSHDLIHKACGWMLREVGKVDRFMLNQFIKDHYDRLSRTTLRYAIEKHDKEIRKEILGGSFKWM